MDKAKGYAWVLFVRPGYEAEYERRHRVLWPEMAEALTAAGIAKYHIFRHGLTLFGYFETVDFDAAAARLAECEVNRRWSDFMAPILVADIDPATRWPFLLPQMMAFEDGTVRDPDWPR